MNTSTIASPIRINTRPDHSLRTSAGTTTTAAETVLTVVPWRDPVVETVGHDACGDYVELFWLGTLGPTATWLLRRLAVCVVNHPDGLTIDVAGLATALGLGSDHGRSATLHKAVNRLVIFGLARPIGDSIAVRSVVPPLTMKQVSRLPTHLRRAHSLWSETPPDSAVEAAYGFGSPCDPTTSSAC